MWKKIISGITTVFMAATMLPGVAFAGGGPIQSLTADASFNPGKGEDLTLRLEMLTDASVYVYAYNSSAGAFNITGGYQDFTTGTHYLEWEGKSTTTGDYAPAGTYSILAYSYKNGTFQNSASTTVEVLSSTSGGSGSSSTKPDVFGVSASDYSTNGKKLSFSVKNDAYLTANITDSSGKVVYKFSNYNFAWTNNSATGTAYNLYWYGYNDSGSKVPSGNYTFNINAVNGYQSDSGSTTFYYGSTSSTAVDVKNLSVNKSSFSPQNGENVKATFDVNKAAYIYSYVSRSDGGVIYTFPGYNYDWHQTAKTHTLYWNGVNSSGNYVTDGTYTIHAYALDANNNIDYQTINVTVNKTDSNKPFVVGLNASPSTFDPSDYEETKVQFQVKEDAYITAYVTKGSLTVRTFSNFDYNYYKGTNDYRTIYWNGRDNYGNLVDDGTYKFYVKTGTSKYGVFDTEYVNVVVNNNDGPYYSSKIKDLDLYPSSKWDPKERNLEINFDLKQYVYNLDVYAKKSGYGTIKIYDGGAFGAGSHDRYWDGRDQYDNLIPEGTWTIVVEADGEKVQRNVTVDYDGSSAGIDAYVTKKEIDPAFGEETYLVFKLDRNAEVDIDIYNSTNLNRSLIHNMDVDKYKWYAVKWDGRKGNGKYADYNQNWRFKITVDDNSYYYNSSNLDKKYVNVEVKHEIEELKAVNVYGDFTEPVVYDDKKTSSIDMSFCLGDRTAVDLEIFKGTNATGQKVATVLNNEDMKGGCHVIKWNAGKYALADGLYSYRVVSEQSYSYKDTEKGVFVIGNFGGVVGNKNPNPTPNPNPTGAGCAGFVDLKNLAPNSEACKAIEWAKAEGIFSGYSDGTFKRLDTINRAEVLKVTLEAFNVKLKSSNGSTLGFSDVNPSAWYMTYVATAKYYGMLDGYADSNKAGMTDDINRAEILKFVLEASEAFTDFEMNGLTAYGAEYSDVSFSKWYYKYAKESAKYNLFDAFNVGGQKQLRPAQLVTRGEVALLLYRMQKSGLLN